MTEKTDTLNLLELNLELELGYVKTGVKVNIFQKKLQVLI
jgi:hypothetical protein